MPQSPSQSYIPTGNDHHCRLVPSNSHRYFALNVTDRRRSENHTPRRLHGSTREVARTSRIHTNIIHSISISNSQSVAHGKHRPPAKQVAPAIHYPEKLRHPNVTPDPEFPVRRSVFMTGALRLLCRVGQFDGSFTGSSQFEHPESGNGRSRVRFNDGLLRFPECASVAGISVNPEWKRFVAIF